MDEDTPENFFETAAVEEDLKDEINYEKAIKFTDSKFKAEISDFSELEDKNDPKEVMADFWGTIDANMDFYLKDRIQDITTPKINNDYVEARARQNFRTKFNYERPERF